MYIESRSGQQEFGAVTRIGGNPATWRSKVGDNTWDWAAVNALVGLTKANVNAAHTNRNNQSSTSHKRFHWFKVVSRKCSG